MSKGKFSDVAIHFCVIFSTRQSAEIMIDLFRRLKSDGFPDMQYLNLGGGLSIPYRQHVSTSPTYTEEAGPGRNGHHSMW